MYRAVLLEGVAATLGVALAAAMAGASAEASVECGLLAPSTVPSALERCPVPGMAPTSTGTWQFTDFPTAGSSLVASVTLTMTTATQSGMAMFG
jgi:hypothetical protein